MPNKKQLLIALSIIPAVITVKILSNFPEFVERFYSNGIYLGISKALRFLLGWLPFSFGDVVYIIGILLLLRWVFTQGKTLFKSPLKTLTQIGCVLAIIYTAFNLFWGLNYYRLPLHKKLNLDNTYSTEELVKITKKIIDKANATHCSITDNDTVKVEIPLSKSEILKKTPEGYSTLAEQFPHLKYTPSSIKSSLISLPLTYMGSSGYLNPFTNEAQVDYLIPKYRYPVVASHEVAHQLGYAAENEANFIGFLAATHHDNIYFNYSGYIFALRYCINEIYRRDKDLFKALKPSINKGIFKNYQESTVFWENYQSPIEPITRSLYTSYLKANSQNKGMESYSYVVALLVNYFKDNSL